MSFGLCMFAFTSLLPQAGLDIADQAVTEPQWLTDNLAAPDHLPTSSPERPPSVGLQRQSSSQNSVWERTVWFEPPPAARGMGSRAAQMAVDLSQAACGLSVPLHPCDSLPVCVPQKQFQ